MANLLSMVGSKLSKGQSELQEIARIINVTKLSAFNKAVQSGMSRTERIARSSYNIKKKELDKSWTIKKANDINEPVSTITIFGKGLPLLQFLTPSQITKSREKRAKKGLKAKVQKRKYSQYPHAFVADLKYGTNVFARMQSGRGSLKALYGISVDQIFSSDWMFDNLKTEVEDRFVNIFFRDLDYKIGKLS